MSEWVVAENYPKEELDKEGVTPEWLLGKWLDVAEDMALIPERNVRVEERGGVVFVEVSEELMNCMRGI
ncbi:hypothetical protein [Salidesulfovibrio brasiliensis]|uniref:hypothetical protein n=1 Tax=Salidesulfovibrio brasiliensis TaxID=221711 RepID=UPI0006CF4E2B|nr:hypothetical protein [Salidesulfovibrio brasiliensis]